MVQLGLDSSYRARLGGSPYKAWFGREPVILLPSLVRDQQEVVGVLPLTDDNVRAMLENLRITCDTMHKRVTHRVQAVRAVGRRRESKGALVNFVLGDYVLVAWAQPPGQHSKNMPSWTGLWRVTNAPNPHVYQAQDIVRGKVTTAHVAHENSIRILPLETLNTSMRPFNMSRTRGSITLNNCSILDEALVRWQRFLASEKSRGSLATLYRDALT